MVKVNGEYAVTISDRIWELRLQISSLLKEIDTLQKSCEHLNLTPDTYGRRAYCPDCLQSFEEYCPKSPTRFCWYNEDGNAIDYHDKCKYCGKMAEEQY